MFMESFATRMILGFFKRPAISFMAYLIIVALFSFTPRGEGIVLLLYLICPWLALLILLLNFPFFCAAFRNFKMAEVKKKNHAVEHGTILLLRAKYEPAARIGGSAESSGFRVWGVKKERHLRRALEDFRSELSNGRAREVISGACGSQIVTAQGFGLAILTASWIAIVLIEPSMLTSGIMLAANVFLYYLLRGKVGVAFQERFFLSTEFTDFRVHSITKVKKIPYIEKGTVHFVKTSFQ